MNYTPKDIIRMLREYDEYMRTYHNLKKEQASNREHINVNAMQYGVESIMPKANVISNPTQRAAEQLLLQDGVLENTIEKIHFIDERAKRLHKNQHIVTFALRTQGHTCEYIASILSVGRTRVQNIINEMAQLMCKDEQEYRLYCKKKKIKPVIGGV